MQIPVNKRSPSLKVDENLIHAYVEHNPLARAAINAWRFREPVVTMDAEEFDRLADQGWHV
jgi:hypothetical protein